MHILTNLTFYCINYKIKLGMICLHLCNKLSDKYKLFINTKYKKYIYTIKIYDYS